MYQFILLGVIITGIIVLGYQVKKSDSQGRRYHSESKRIHDMTQQRAKIVANVEKERARQNVRHEGGYYPY